MTTPVCPIHQTPMRAGRGLGKFFCPRKNPDGTWCGQKIELAVPVPVQPAVLPAQAPAPTPVAPFPTSAPGAGDVDLAIAVLTLAGQLPGFNTPDEVRGWAEVTFDRMRTLVRS